MGGRSGGLYHHHHHHHHYHRHIFVHKTHTHLPQKTRQWNRATRYTQYATVGVYTKHAIIDKHLQQNQLGILYKFAKINTSLTVRLNVGRAEVQGSGGGTHAGFGITLNLETSMSRPILHRGPFQLPASSSYRGFGERCKLPSRVWGRAQPNLNLMHFSHKMWHLVATILIIFIRTNWLNLTKIAPIIQWIPCALVQKMSTSEKVGAAKHRASPPLQKVGECPSIHPRNYAHAELHVWVQYRSLPALGHGTTLHP